MQDDIASSPAEKSAKAAKDQREKLLTRWGQLKTERSTWMTHWTDITTYLLPRQGRYFVQDRNRGNKRHNAIFDQTGTRALGTLAAGLMGGLTSPARPWFRLGTRNSDMMRNAPVREWLSHATTVMMDVFQRSNTYRVLPAMYLELAAFGTATALVAEDFENVIHMFPFTVGEYCIATNWKGEVDTFYREFQKTVAEIVGEFGIENVSSRTKQLFESGKNLDTWITILHAVEPRAVRDENAADAKNMPWRSVYYELGGDGDKPLRDSGFRRFRILAPRWDVAGGDVYGNSPAMEALGDVKQLQQEQLRKSQAIDYQSNPPLQVPTNLKNRDVDRLPGGVTFRDGSGAGDKIETMFDVRLDLGHLLADIQDVRMRIKSSFFADLFLMISQDDPTGTRMTATEVAERREEKMLMLGPVLERLHNELLSPLIDITFDSIMDAGLLPPPPPELQGEDLSIELVSMLAQAQRAIATNGVDRFVGNLTGLAQFKPEILDKLDTDYWADNYSDMLGVDPLFVVPEEKVQMIRAQRAAAQQKAQEAAQQEQQANTIQKLATSPTQGGQSTALDAIGQFSGYTSPGA